MYEHNRRGRSAAFENIHRNDALAKAERISAEAVRSRLEANSGRGERRLPLGLTLAAFSAVDAVARRPVNQVVSNLRKLAGRSDHPANSTMAAPNFEIGSRSNWSHESGSDIAPPSERQLVGDAGGSISSDARTERSHFADLGVRSAFEDTMSVEDMRALAARRWRGRFF
jgi:hypothetical protein